MEKLKVYIHTFEIPTVGFVDKEGAMHACAQAQKTAFQGLGQRSGLLGNRYLCNEDEEVLMLVEGFCKSNGLEYDIIDLGTMSFLARLRLRMKGVNSPAICCGEKIIWGVPSEEDLKKLLRRNQKATRLAF
jgi:glutaredoxin